MRMLHRPNPLDAPLYRKRAEEILDLHPLARSLIEARLAWRLTQREVASRMGVRREYLARLEVGELQPALSTLEKWANALGYDLGLKSRPVE